MKKLIVVLIGLFIAGAASAQVGHGGFRGHVYAIQPRISVGLGYYPFYSPFGFYGYPYGSYFPYRAGYARESKLQRKEEDIRADYSDRIYSVRHDSSLSSKQKRETVRSLKKQRKQDLHDLVANYHKQPVNP